MFVVAVQSDSEESDSDASDYEGLDSEVEQECQMQYERHKSKEEAAKWKYGTAGEGRAVKKKPPAEGLYLQHVFG